MEIESESKNSRLALSLLFEERGKKERKERRFKRLQSARVTASVEITLKRGRDRERERVNKGCAEERERGDAKDTALIYVPGAEVASQRRATS